MEAYPQSSVPVPVPVAVERGRERTWARGQGRERGRGRGQGQGRGRGRPPPGLGTTRDIFEVVPPHLFYFQLKTAPGLPDYFTLNRIWNEGFNMK